MASLEVEDIADQFARSLTADDEDTKAYRMSLFKGHDNNHINQEARRKVFLERQKSQRDSELDSKRGILEIVEEVEKCEVDIFPEAYKPTVFVPGFNKKASLSEIMMFSEWMVEKPTDFHENWLILACPVGIRVLLVARNGQTKILRKSGRHHRVWQSILPGGSRGSKNCCVLDCIWSEETQSIYILDVLLWVNQTVTDCDMTFRDSWIRSKYAEFPGLDQVSAKNHYPIYLIPKYNCDKVTLDKFMMNWPAYYDNCPGVDGLLFYHKEAHYMGGMTPLVGWLYPFMVNEILGSDITVHEEYLLLRPESYTNQKDFIDKYEKEQSEKKKKNKLFATTSINTTFTDESDQSSIMVFSANGNSPKPRKARRNRNRKNKMDLDEVKDNKNSMDLAVNLSIDSAISSLEDSIVSEENVIEPKSTEMES